MQQTPKLPKKDIKTDEENCWSLIYLNHHQPTTLTWKV